MGNLLVRGKTSYQTNIGVYRSLIQMKKEKESLHILFNPDIIEIGNNLSIAKYNDVQNVLETHLTGKLNLS